MQEIDRQQKEALAWAASMEPSLRTIVAVGVAMDIIRATGVEEFSEIHKILDDPSLTALEKETLLAELSENIDTHYFDLQDAGDPTYILFFRRARAVMSLQGAVLADDPSQFSNFVYEGSHALITDYKLSQNTQDQRVGIFRLGAIAVSLGFEKENPFPEK